MGRVETGDFIAVPEVAHRVLALLAQGHTVSGVASLLREETGKEFAIRDFVAALDEIGFIAAIDDEIRAETSGPVPSLAWLRPAHVRWLLHPAVSVIAGSCAIIVAVLLATHHALVPSSRVLVWNRHAGLVLAVNVAIGWSLILVHELAHLGTARAAGVPARITLSTRLQFLAAQTDVSGVWGSPRRFRMTVYLAGIAADVCIAAACLVILVATTPHGLARQLLNVVVAEALLMVLAEFQVFMRTDVYFIMQDLAGCANLYAEGTAFLRYLAGRVTRHSFDSRTDPSQTYPLRQRRALRAYSTVLLVGTVICLSVEFAVSLPALVTLVACGGRDRDDRARDA